MFEVRIVTEPIEADQAGLGDYAFDVIPRIGETVHLYFNDAEKTYTVNRVEYHFMDHTKPPLLRLVVELLRSKRD